MISLFAVAIPALRTGVATVATRRGFTKRAENLAACAAYPLPARLQAVLDATPSTTVVAADIGCDHGLLSVALATSGRVERVLACDCSPNALDGARKTLEDTPGSPNVAIRLGDGVESLTEDDNVDTIVMAGLGVVKMIDILREMRTHAAAKSVQTLLLQPMAPRLSFMAVLRVALRRSGFDVRAEHFMTSRGRPYLTLLAVRRGIGQQRPSHWDDTIKLLGPAPHTHERAAFNAYVHHQARWLAREVDGLQSAKVVAASGSKGAKLRRWRLYAEIANKYLREHAPSSGVSGDDDDDQQHDVDEAARVKKVG